MERKRYESPVLTFAMFAVIFVGFVATVLDPSGLAAEGGGRIDVGILTPVRLALVVAGIALITAGFAIRFVAIATLKRNFSGALRIRADHTLVRSGIYARVRHPAYLGALVLFPGFAIMMSSVLGLLVMLLLVPLLLHRIKLEERMMVERFGREYEDYMRVSNRLIPRIH